MDPAYNQGMNWITRCPECATVYQVHPEQPLAAKGWLRCGRCEHVFDSTGLLLAWSAASLSDEALPDVAFAGGAPTATERVDIDALLKREDGVGAGHASAASADLTSFEHALSSFKPELEKAIADLATALPDSPLPGNDDMALSESPLAVTRRRWPSILIVICLTLGLSAQCVWAWRHNLTALFPQIEPVFLQACRLMACDHAHRRDVQAMVIDTSSFIPSEDGYQLKWIVRNTTSQILEMTALELTLQDIQGKPVLRRVFLPAELGAPKNLAPSQVWQGDIRLKVDSDTPVTGYRVLSFYP
jgi:predicted Zn finger-like uncharacterized protein